VICLRGDNGRWFADSSIPKERLGKAAAKAGKAESRPAASGGA